MVNLRKKIIDDNAGERSDMMLRSTSSLHRFIGHERLL